MGRHYKVAARRQSVNGQACFRCSSRLRLSTNTKLYSRVGAHRALIGTMTCWEEELKYSDQTGRLGWHRPSRAEVSIKTRPPT